MALLSLLPQFQNVAVHAARAEEQVLALVAGGEVGFEFVVVVVTDVDLVTAAAAVVVVLAVDAEFFVAAVAYDFLQQVVTSFSSFPAMEEVAVDDDLSQNFDPQVGEVPDFSLQQPDQHFQLEMCQP